LCWLHAPCRLELSVEELRRMDGYIWWIVAFITTTLILLTSLFVVLGLSAAAEEEAQSRQHHHHHHYHHPPTKEKGKEKRQEITEWEPMSVLKNIEEDAVSYAAELRRRSREAAGIFQSKIAHKERASHFPVPEYFSAVKQFRKILLKEAARKGVSHKTQDRIIKCIEDIGTKLYYNHVLVFFKAGIQLLDLALKEAHGEKSSEDVRDTFGSCSLEQQAGKTVRNIVEEPIQVWDLAPEIFLVPSFDVMKPKQVVSARCSGIFFIPLADIIKTEEPRISPREKYDSFVAEFWSRVEREIELLPPLPSKYKRLAWSRQSEKEGVGRLGLTRRLYSTAESLKDKTTRKSVTRILDEVLEEIPAEKAGIQDWIKSKALDEETLCALNSMLEYKNC